MTGYWKLRARVRHTRKLRARACPFLETLNRPRARLVFLSGRHDRTFLPNADLEQSRAEQLSPWLPPGSGSSRRGDNTCHGAAGQANAGSELVSIAGYAPASSRQPRNLQIKTGGHLQGAPPARSHMCVWLRNLLEHVVPRTLARAARVPNGKSLASPCRPSLNFLHAAGRCGATFRRPFQDGWTSQTPQWPRYSLAQPCCISDVVTSSSAKGICSTACRHLDGAVRSNLVRQIVLTLDRTVQVRQEHPRGRHRRTGRWQHRQYDQRRAQLGCRWRKEVQLDHGCVYCIPKRAHAQACEVCCEGGKRRFRTYGQRAYPYWQHLDVRIMGRHREWQWERYYAQLHLVSWQASIARGPTGSPRVSSWCPPGGS